MLRIVQTLQLPDWWIGAGFVRSKIWDHLHKYSDPTALPDVDVIYFDTFNPSVEQVKEIKLREKAYEKTLARMQSGIEWSVTNQSRMHQFHNEPPYHNSTEALARWVETATCIGVRLDTNQHVMLTAPHGIDDLVNLILRPTPGAGTDTKTFHERIQKKEWIKKWPKLQIINSSNDLG